MKVNLHTSKVGTLVYFIHKELNLGGLFDRQTQNILSFFFRVYQYFAFTITSGKDATSYRRTARDVRSMARSILEIIGNSALI